MTFVHIEGFEIDQTEAALGMVYGEVLNYPNMSFVTGDSATGGGYYLRNDGSGQSIRLRRDAMNAGDDKTCIIGFRVRCNKMAETDGWELVIRDQATPPGNPLFTLKGEWNNGTNTWNIALIQTGVGTLGFTSDIYVPNEWYYVELKIKIDGTQGVWHVRVDEQTIIGDDVEDQNTGTTDWGAISLSCSNQNDAAAYVDLDDWHVVDGAGTVDNDFRGNVAIERLDIVGDSLGQVAPFKNEWTLVKQGSGSGTQNYQMVDDAQHTTPIGNDGDETAVQTPDDDKYDVYQVSDPIFATGQLMAIQISADVRLRAHGSKTIRLPSGVFVPTPDMSDGPDFTVTQTQYSRFTRVVDLDAMPGLPGPSEVTALGFHMGIKSQS
jgi:hypothetical protein